MVRETFVIEKTVEEEMVLCDNCGKEVDENGGSFVKNSNLHVGPTIHFCSDCLQDFTDGDVKPRNVERVEEWLDTEWDALPLSHDKQDIRSVRKNVGSATEWTRLLFYIGLLLSFVSLFVSTSPVITIPKFYFAMYGVGATAALFVTYIQVSRISDAIDRADEVVRNS